MASDEDAADAVQNSRAGGKAKADGGQGGKNGKAVIQKTDTQEEEEDEENPFPPTTLGAFFPTSHACSLSAYRPFLPFRRTCTDEPRWTLIKQYGRVKRRTLTFPPKSSITQTTTWTSLLPSWTCSPT
jgi:hypothetical protein